jgi:hypothetical protein
MNLSFYLLLAPSTEREQSPATAPPPNPQSRQKFVPVYDLQPRIRAGSRRPVQASRKSVHVITGKGTAKEAFEHGMSVFANALGFLVLTGGALLLLRVTETSLI